MNTKPLNQKGTANKKTVEEHGKVLVHFIDSSEIIQSNSHVKF